MIQGEKKGKSVLITGLAPCLMQDWEEARKHRPNSEVILVNYSCTELVGDYLFTLHPEQVKEMRRVALQKDLIVLSTSNRHNEKYAPFENDVDYWLPGDKFNGATSAYAAARAAVWLGYEEVILVGCPLDENSRKYYGKYKRAWEYRPRQIHDYANKLAEYHDRFDDSKIRSMSGMTKRILGAPIWQAI